MICSCCKSEFDNIHRLRFCPYCGTKIDETDALNTEHIETEEMQEIKDASEEIASTNEKFDTLKMPVITKEQIRKYKREQFFNSLTKPFKNLKVVITVMTVVLFLASGIVGYFFLVGRPVDEGRIKDDIIGKSVVLPKGASLEIKKGYIKSFSISERNTNKGEKKDDIKVSVILNNGTIEVKTLLALQYVYEGNDKWVIGNKVDLAGETTVKPLVGMDEKLILDEVKKATINIGNTSKVLSDADVKTLSIASRTADFENLKEEVLVDAGIDSGIVAASGKIKCTLSFQDEAWSVASIERNGTDDFALVLSPAFSQDKILDVIKKDVQNLTVTSPNVFGGKGFYVNDSFTKSINITDKKFDAQSGNLNVTVKKQNTAGELKSVISADYTFGVSFSKVELLKKSKPALESVEVNDISKDFIASSITNAEMEGNNLLFWYSDNHKITAEEAKTFNTSKVLSKKGLENVKYVYGSITYKDGNKQKTSSLVATYFLVYDSSKGYNWKLDRVVGEDSPNYKRYIPEPQ